MTDLAQGFSSLTSPRIGDFFPSLLFRDLSSGIFPILSGSKNWPNYEAKFVGEDSETAQRFFLRLGRFSDSSVSELISDFFGMAAATLFVYGRSVYQVRMEPFKARLEPRLVSVTPKRLFGLPGFYFHFVPRKDREHFGRSVLIKSSRDVWDIRFPSALDSPILFRFRLSLIRLANRSSPRFFMERLKRGKPSGMDLKEYSRLRAQFVARLTSRYGWNRRDSGLDNSTEYFFLYRTLRTRAYQTLLRDHLLLETNKILQRHNFSAKLEISGLPTYVEISTALSKLEAGKTDYETFTKFNLY